MRKFFRQLSLPKKLILVGVVPLAFLCYVAFELYNEKKQRVALLNLYTQRIYQSENLAKLIDALQNERKLSFDHSISKELGRGLLAQRHQTDTLLNLIKTTSDISLVRFEEYSFVNRLPAIRSGIDENKAGTAQIMDVYTTMIFRLNTLNTSFPATRIYLKPVANDLAAQRLLTEMQTYLGIIRSNIFNVLHSRAYVVETLVGTNGVYQVFQSYEKEFLIKAPPEVIGMYEQTKRTTALKPTLEYIDTVFRKFGFDSTYNAETWWEISDEGINSLRLLQQKLWKTTRVKISNILDEETYAKDQTLIFLVLALIAVAGIVSYTIHIISSVLNELKKAAGHIAEGNPDVEIEIHSRDAIGSLAESIRIMEKQVRERTMALQQINDKLESSNRELEQFAYIASHDLQEPVRKIRTFADQLKSGNYENLDDNGKKFIDKIASSAARMKLMINDILEFSQLERNEGEIKEVDLNTVLNNVQTDLELLITQKNAVIKTERLPVVEGIPVQLNQLFYNLVNNALKFSKEDVSPVISITTSKPSDKVLDRIGTQGSKNRYFQLNVKDNGIGFNQEYAEKIFAMFQRLTTERTGTGIGLALCKKIVENHNGYIEAESAPGVGTTFRIILPQKQT